MNCSCHGKRGSAYSRRLQILRRVVKVLLGNLGHGLGGFFHMSLRSLFVLDDSSIPEPIELGKLEKLKTQLARKIDNKWMKETAETLGILDSDFIKFQ